MDTIFVTDIKLAAILISMGIPKRDPQPITCEVINVNGKPEKLFKFWFDVADPVKKDEAKKFILAYSKAWEEMTLDPEHSLYYMKGALDTRETLLHWIRSDVEPMKRVTVTSPRGRKLEVLMSYKANQETRNKMDRLVRNM